MKLAGVLAVVLLPTLVFAQNQNKKKHSVSEAFNNARYVWVESMDGDIFTPGLLPADRQAIADVQNALRDWGRYALTADRSQAELIFVVRAGRLAEGNVGGRVGPQNSRPIGASDPGQQQRPMGPGVMLGGEIGPPYDLLKVILTNSQGPGTEVWFRSEESGLASPDVPLFQRLKRAVDHDYPR